VTVCELLLLLLLVLLPVLLHLLQWLLLLLLLLRAQACAAHRKHSDVRSMEKCAAVCKATAAVRAL
jgi:hypothetical protein